MKKLLSVIVPVYNAEPYLACCIQSILNQSMREIEIILVNDGSTDESRAVCDLFCKLDQRVRVLHQSNQGPIAARSKGLSACSGTYVTFVDADDFVARESFAAAQESMQKGVDLISFGIYRYYDENLQRYEAGSFQEGIYKKEAIEKRLWPSMLWDCEANRFGMDPSLCSKIVKKERILPVYKRLEGKNFHYGEDVAVIYPLLTRIETLEIQKYAYYYHRQGKKNAVAGYLADKDYLDRLFQLYRVLKEELSVHTCFTKQIEYFYIYSAELRKRCYRDLARPETYLFPFDKVNKGETIILYGAGVVGQSYMVQLKKIGYCTVALWVDRNFKDYQARGVASPAAIQDTAFDRIVIAVDSVAVKREIRSYLSARGIDKEKIL